MPPLTPLVQIADTARLVGGDATTLFLAMPDGHRLRADHARTDTLVLISENMRLIQDGTGMHLDKVHHRLAVLPAVAKTWATAPQARWAETQAFLHDHAQRPMLFLGLMRTLCRENLPSNMHRIEIGFRHGPGTHQNGPAYTSRSGFTREFPYASRIAALKIQTVCMQKSPGALLSNTAETLHVDLPQSMHARMQSMTALEGLQGIEQIAQLESLWLGRPHA